MPAPAGKDAGPKEGVSLSSVRGRCQAVIGARHLRWNVWRRATSKPLVAGAGRSGNTLGLAHRSRAGGLANDVRPIADCFAQTVGVACSWSVGQRRPAVGTAAASGGYSRDGGPSAGPLRSSHSRTLTGTVVARAVASGRCYSSLAPAVPLTNGIRTPWILGWVWIGRVTARWAEACSDHYGPQGGVRLGRPECRAVACSWAPGRPLGHGRPAHQRPRHARPAPAN